MKSIKIHSVIDKGEEITTPYLKEKIYQRYGGLENILGGNICSQCGKTIREQMRGCNIITCPRQFK